MKLERRLVGYYTSPEQADPTFDPGIGVACPICEKPIVSEDDVRSHSMMRCGGRISVFYRTHRTCAEANPLSIPELDSQALAHGDAVWRQTLQ